MELYEVILIFIAAAIVTVCGAALSIRATESWGGHQPIGPARPCPKSAPKFESAVVPPKHETDMAAEIKALKESVDRLNAKLDK